MPRRLILASTSPRRRELLSLLRLPFEIVPSRCDEDDLLARQGDPRQTAEHIAYEKAWDLFNQIRFDELSLAERNLIIAADTIVALTLDGNAVMLAKPVDAGDARRMLELLSGAAHSVFTAVCVMECDWNEAEDEWIPMWNIAVVETRVSFRELTSEMIDAYLATGEPFDKAGAYGIQGYASAFVERIEGDYFNVVGLPVSTVARMLENIGVEWWRGAEALN